MSLKEFVETLSIVSGLQGLIFGLIFLFNLKKNKSLVFLGLFLVAFTGTSFQWFLINKLPPFGTLPLTFSYLSLPLFFLYVQSIFGRFKPKSLLHLVPGLLEVIVNCFLAINPELAKYVYSPNSGILGVFFLVIAPPLYSLVYCVLCLYLKSKYQEKIGGYFTDLEIKRSNWIKISSIILIIDLAHELLSSMGMLFSNLDLILYVFQALNTGFVVYWTSIFGLQQKNLIPTEDNNKDDNDNYKLDFEGLEKATHPKLPEEGHYKVEDYEKIVRFFNETKIYRNKEINLFVVADLLQKPYKEVSKLINLYAQKNFNQFVNSFRVEEAKLLLLDPKKNHLNLNGIADKVGFNSRSTFFSTFKKHEGKTPSEFKKDLISN